MEYYIISFDAREKNTAFYHGMCEVIFLVSLILSCPCWKASDIFSHAGPLFEAVCLQLTKLVPNFDVY
jgi:hypothetical protein